jgi:predicted MFS family arabinose efflux permease
MSVHRARIAVALLFLAYGAIIGTWTARIPAIKHSLGLSDGQLSIALLAFAAGAITGMQAVGRLVDRYGSAKTMIPAALADGVLLVPPGYAPNLVTLALCVYLLGAVHGTLNVAMNANAVEVQRARGKPIISSFHAVYSIGGFLGAAIGGLFAYAGRSAGSTFLAVGCTVIALALWAAQWAMRSAPQRRAAEPVRPQRIPGLLFLGLLAFCCLVGEGAAADWSSVYLRDSLGSTAAFAATAYAAFSVLMIAGRLAGDRLVTRFGPVALVRGCGILAATGLMAALLVSRPIAGVIGFGCLGAGLSCIAPQVFSTAGNLDRARAGQAIARVASLGFLGFLTGPLLIGGAAELVGLARALTIPALLALFVALTASALRRSYIQTGTTGASAAPEFPVTPPASPTAGDREERARETSA